MFLFHRIMKTRLFYFLFTQGKCKKGEGIMMIAVTIDKSLNEISPSLRISAMQKLSNHLNISPVS